MGWRAGLGPVWRQRAALLAFLLVPCIVLGCNRISFESITAQPPFARFEVTRRGETAVEVFAVLLPEVLLEDVVDVSLFAGFEPGMTLEEAEAANGPATGSALDEKWTSSTWHYFDRPRGRVGVMRVATSDDGFVWQLCGRPTGSSLEEVVVHAGAVSQLRHLNPSRSLSIMPSSGQAGLHASLYLAEGVVSSIVLTGQRAGTPTAGERASLPNN